MYIFTHGGFTHSVSGALLTAAVAAVAFALILGASGHNTSIAIAVVVALGGVLSHIGLDFLAYPGIPLLYPLSDKKFTLGIAAGPSMYITVASLLYLVLILSGRASLSEAWLYLGFFVLVLIASLALKVYVGSREGCMAIPGLNPLKWLIVAETPGSYIVYHYDLLRGRSGGIAYDKLSGLSPGEAHKHDHRPEMRRMRYHSYVVIAERNGDDVKYYDPLREYGHLWYPPYYKAQIIPDKC